MHKNWRFIPGLKALTVTLTACAALALNHQVLLAQQQERNPNTTPQQEQDSNTTIYVVDAGGAWGAAQDAAVTAAGGTILFKHGPAGLATVSSSDPVFMPKVLKSGALSKVAEDVVVQWQDPNERTQLEEEIVTPGNETFINLQWNMTAIAKLG